MILLVCGCYVVFVGPIAVINMTDAEGNQSGKIKIKITTSLSNDAQKKNLDRICINCKLPSVIN